VIESTPLVWLHDGRSTALWRLSGEGQAGLAPLEQLAVLVDDCAVLLAKQELALENLVHQRLWLRDRAMRAEIDEPRRILLGEARRAASSSFISAARFAQGGDVALDLLVQRPVDRGSRRLVDFTPPRRYAWYLLQDGWQHFSGMAETGASLVLQFDAACGEIERGLLSEGRGWDALTEAHLFLQRGRGDEAWLRQAFAKRSGLAPPRIAFDWVDGLASADKHLEIEAVARPIRKQRT